MIINYTSFNLKLLLFYQSIFKFLIVQLSSYLFEHQPRFGPSIHSIASIQQSLSHLDVLVESNYEQRSQMEKYMIDVCFISKFEIFFYSFSCLFVHHFFTIIGLQ